MDDNLDVRIRALQDENKTLRERVQYLQDKLNSAFSDHAKDLAELDSIIKKLRLINSTA